MEQKDKITIIVPCYNSEKFLRKCLDSIIKQTYSNIEIIAIDDGSTDKSLEILNAYSKKDKRIIVISKKNSGVSNTRNIGIKKATGKYIMFADADDYLELDAVESLYIAITENNVNVVRGKFRRQLKHKSYDENSIFKYNSMDKQDIICNILRGNINCYVWLLIINVKVLKKLNIIFNSDLKIMEDTLFYIQLLEKENIYFYDKVVYNYVDNINSASRSIKNTEKIYIEMLKAEGYIINELKKNNQWNENLRNIVIKKIIINGICNCSWNLYKNKEKKLLDDFLKYIEENEEIKLIFSIMDTKDIRLDKRIAIKLIKNKKYKKLFLLYKFKYSIFLLFGRSK